ncbi:MAG TPA: hypothetical protein VFK81_11815 [Terriglobales bacterium]|nr:hypothetical protein [Terriglobales bacterium]
MAGTAGAVQVKTPNEVGKWYTRVRFSDFVETWWVRIPRKLRPYSRILWTAWGDGTYLTAWPRAATILPLAVLLVGFTAGATHLSPLTIADRLSSGGLAVAFLQMVLLLFLGVFLGALSANLGLTLVIGYGLADFIAGPLLTAARPGLLSTFFELRVPQLLSYALFFGLVVTPLVLSNSLLSPLYRRFSAKRLPGALLHTAASATVMMLLVYGWTLMAPFALRVMWSWPGQIPPVTPSSFHSILNPWLPLAAGVGVVLRAVLAWRTRRDQTVGERIARLRREAERADQNLKWTRTCPPWARSVTTAVASTLLTAALLSTWLLATLVFIGFLSLDFLRRSVLPRVDIWQWWSGKVMIAPIILRLGTSVVLTYYITLEVLRVPGWAAGANGIPGQFGAELVSLALGVAVMFFLMPATDAAFPAALKPVTISRSAMRAGAVMLLLAWALFATPQAFAICLDPACCFGDNGNAGLGVAGLGLGLGGMGMGPSGGTGDDGGDGGGDGGSSGSGASNAAGGEGASQGGAAAGGGDGGGGGGAGDAAGGEGASQGASSGGGDSSGSGGAAGDAAAGEGASQGASSGGGGGGGAAGDAAASEGASQGASSGGGDGGGSGGAAGDAAAGEGASQGASSGGGDSGGSGGAAGDAAASEGASQGASSGGGDSGGSGGAAGDAAAGEGASQGASSGGGDGGAAGEFEQRRRDLGGLDFELLIELADRAVERAAGRDELARQPHLHLFRLPSEPATDPFQLRDATQLS